MLGTLDKAPQLDIFRDPLKHAIREEDELYKLAGMIQWDRIISTLSVYYSPDKGRRAIPVRKLAGLLILKRIFNVTDESLLRLWTENLSFQYFCGEVYLQKQPPVSRSDLVKFRSRIGKKGVEAIFYPDLLIRMDRLRKALDNREEQEPAEWNFLDFLRKIFPRM